MVGVAYRRTLLFGLSLLSSLVAAFLLFVVEPMVARKLLPQFGGGPTVWTTCLLFFQIVLLVAYWYVHFVTQILSLRTGVLIHSSLICVALFSSLLQVELPTLTFLYPEVHLLSKLAVTIGLSFFVLGTSAPLIQYWFQAATKQQPYFLYAASNLGSAIAVLVYPLFVEPHMMLDTQFFTWSVSYRVLLVLLLVYGLIITVLKYTQQSEDANRGSSAQVPTASRGRWFFLAFFPSSLLLGVTHYLTAHVAPIPLLWMIPLFLYLVTYIWAFARPSLRGFDLALRSYIILLLGVIFGIWLEVGSPFALFSLLHLSAFFIACLLCHTVLAVQRPSPSLLTSYYGWIALGGASGALMNAVLAPLLFTTYLEYPLALLGVLLCLDQSPPALRRLPLSYILGGLGLPFVLFLVLLTPVFPFRESVVVLLGCMIVMYAFSSRADPRRFLVILVSFLIVGLWYHGDFAVLLKRDRNFFGQIRVGETASRKLRTFVHGSTIHGSQLVDTDQRCKSLDYYWAGGPAGTLLTSYQNSFKPRAVGLLGLGIGSMLSYRRSEEQWIALEIDQNVVDVARGFFSYFTCGSGPDVSVRVGDGRLLLQQDVDQKFDLLIVDAFTSDAIPLHLLTKEAFQLYQSRLTQNGMLLLHVSNNFLALEGPVAASAAALNLSCKMGDDTAYRPERESQNGAPSQWIAVSQSAAVDHLFTGNWRDCQKGPLWTDNYSSLYEVVRW